MFVWLHYILWNPFLLLLLGRKWLNSNDYCVIITSVIVEYADGHCLLVLLRCKITFIFILFPFLVMLEPNGHCVNMTAFCIIALFSCFCPDFFFFYSVPLPDETMITSVTLLCFFSPDVKTFMFCLTEQNKVFMFRFFFFNKWLLLRTIIIASVWYLTNWNLEQGRLTLRPCFSHELKGTTWR